MRAEEEEEKEEEEKKEVEGDRKGGRPAFTLQWRLRWVPDM